ncbi:MAG: DUF4097 family beta strand repeat-containing protein [Candidatus Aminicenantes bacterium]|nr:DUF4097 family beta strand repeat-containing protein [Candidatus Aminicenantes bacterium]
MNTHKRLFLYALVLVMAGTFLYAQGEGKDRATVPFSNPGKSGLVKVSTMRGAITVKGYNGKEVIVDAVVREKMVQEEPVKMNEKASGLKLIQVDATGLTIREDENIMRISVNSFRQTIDLTIQVPYKTSLQLQGHQGGDITVTGVEGELDITNFSGSVFLMDVSGSAIANSYNGEVKAVFKKINPDEPMSFTTWNGDIDVTLPASAKANMKLKSDRGNVYTDFDLQVVKDPKDGFEFTKKRGDDDNIGLIIAGETVPDAPTPPTVVVSPRGVGRDIARGVSRDVARALARDLGSRANVISFDKSIYAKVNGGGPVYQFKNYNGDIMIRKAK